MKFFLYSSVITSVFLLGGCSLSAQEPPSSSHSSQIEKEQGTPTVTVQKLIPQQWENTLAVTGIIEAKEEIRILSEVMGTVSKVHVEEGDEVDQSDTIITLDAGTNIIQSSYNNASDTLKNARVSYSLIDQSGRQSVETAKIAVQQAEENMKRAKITVEKARISYEKTRDTKPLSLETQETKTQLSKTSVEIAEKNLSLLKKSHSDLLEKEEEKLESLLENLSNQISKTFITLDSDMVFVDELIGASSLRRSDNDDFEVYLEGREGGLMLSTKDLWNQTFPKIEELEEQFRAFKKPSYTQDDEEFLMKYLEEMEVLMKTVLEIEGSLYKLLAQSIASKNLSKTKIESLKMQTIEKQKALESIVNILEGMEQQIETFHIESPQKISDLEIKISLAESQLIASQQSLSTLSLSEESVHITLDAEVENAKQTYDEALSNLRNAEIQHNKAISSLKNKEINARAESQKGRTQVDSAENILDQASISLSKLNITPGIKGIVSSVLVADGDTVTPGKLLATVSDFSELKLTTDISVSESMKIQEGDTALVSLEGVDTPVQGYVTLIFPQADPITRRIQIEITIPNERNIPSKIFATATIKSIEEEKGIVISKKHILSLKNDPFVLVAEEQEDSSWSIKKRFIAIQKENSDAVLISSGLSESDVLIGDTSKKSLVDSVVQIQEEAIETSMDH